MRKKTFRYNEATHIVESLDPSVAIIGYSGFAMTKGVSVVFDVEGKLRGISMVYEFVDCPNGRLMVVEKGKTRPQCIVWTGIRLEGRCRVEDGEGITSMVKSEPFVKEYDRQEFIPLAVEFLTLFRMFPVSTHGII